MRHYLHRVELLRDEMPGFGIYPLCLDAVAVAWGFNAEGGSRNVHFDTRRSHSPLHESALVQRRA